jgi:hypothetical protein
MPVLGYARPERSVHELESRRIGLRLIYIRQEWTESSQFKFRALTFLSSGHKP